ncbi:MAG: FAD-binding oxidoreductase, partial [Candidatus Neomarinimicrobiota bacterium]
MKPLTDYLPADRIHADRLSRLAYAHDASLYRLIPAKVVKPRSEREVQSLLAYCRELGTHVTFRTGGTSLSGQAVTDGILADVTRFWMNHHIGPDG